ncbi:MAG TPA: ATP synthase subunit I [Bryobacteraceae bacterium]|nr:ATP synthase subunit I [Bryobacteraceae bacterium]
MRTDATAVARRVYSFMAALATGGLVVAVAVWGAQVALGFAIGVIISFGNAWWMHRVSMSIGQDSERPKGAPLLAVFRYLMMGGILYAILNFSESGFLAALAGCFVHIIAVVLEVVFELTYGTP